VKKRTFFHTLLLMLCVCFTHASAADKPNILFIMVDDLGKDWIGCYGADNIETPHIDRLAETGLKFNKAWSMPQCTPTRATLLTGQYPWRTGWVNHWDVPRWGVGYFDWERYTTFATVVKQAGYTTAIAGKWQINDFRIEPRALEKHGFDDWCVWTGYEAENLASAKRYWDPYIHTRSGSRTYKGQFGPDVYCDFLIEFMRTHRDEPMMLYFPMALTHGPLVHTPHEPNATDKWPRFKAMVRYTDHLVGRLMATLDELKLRENTIVIFTTDNGSGGGVRGTVAGKRPTGGKATKYEGGVCEPFIVNCPGRVPNGTETDALTDFSDLLPTFAELAGAPLPKDVPLDGHSIAPIILGKTTKSTREWILAMGHGAGRVDAKGVRGVNDYADRVMRDERYKVWIETNRQIVALYDLQEDPLEQTNLLANVRPDIVAARLKFEGLVRNMPPVDARPKYRPRKPLSWDRKPRAAQPVKRQAK